MKRRAKLFVPRDSGTEPTLLWLWRNSSPRQTATHLPSKTCWIWGGALNKSGYGTVRANGRTTLVHRLGWVLSGRVIEDRRVLDHLCRNRSCWNPDHLEPVTSKENTQRGLACKRGAPCTKCGGSRFSKTRRSCLDCRKGYDAQRRTDPGVRARQRVYGRRHDKKRRKRCRKSRRAASPKSTPSSSA